MTEPPAARPRTVTLQSAGGTPVLTVPLLPAALAAGAALALAPRLTAAAALLALLRRMSLCLDGDTAVRRDPAA